MNTEKKPTLAEQARMILDDIPKSEMSVEIFSVLSSIVKEATAIDRIDVLSEDDLMSADFKNDGARLAFLNTFTDWSVWRRDDVLGVTVYAVKIMDAGMITAAAYDREQESYSHARWNFIKPVSNVYTFSPMTETRQQIANRLKGFRQEIVERRRGKTE
jgi:hypothetical protein